MARVWMTNRYGLHRACPPMVQVDPREQLEFDSSPYGRFNMGLKVGDERERVLQNRETLARACGLEYVIFMDQVHSNLMLQAIKGDELQCDGIFIDRDSATESMGLGVQVADCVPLVLTHPNLIAAVHIGREGLVKGMTEAAIERLRMLVAITEVRAVIGPSICGDCYPLSEEIFTECTERYPASLFDPTLYKVDVAAGVTSILDDAGISWSWFAGERECVSCDPDYYSYRRDGVTGRQAMVVGW